MEMLPVYAARGTHATSESAVQIWPQAQQTPALHLVPAGQGAFGMWRGAERMCFGKKFWGGEVVMCLLSGQEGTQPSVEYQDWVY